MRRLKKLTLIACLMYLPILQAEQVSTSQGNLYYVDQQNIKHQLSSLGIDSQPALSSDKKQLVFIRTPASQQSELWIMDVSGNNARILIREHHDDDVTKNLSELNNPLFALNNQAVYFLSVAWATSNAVHVVDLKTGKHQFITDGNSVELVRNGKYQGYLIVSKHKYYNGGGSFEEYWLVSPTGKEIKSLPENHQKAVIQLN